jgi:mycothiol synthase
LVEKAGNIIGYLNVIPELDIERVVLGCLIHPAHRRKGLGTMLVSSAMNYAFSKDAKAVHTNILDDNMVGKKFLNKLGFKFVRSFPILRLNLSEIRLKYKTQNFQIRCLKQGEEEKLTKLQNRSFANTWGYHPNTIEEISDRINLSDYSTNDIIIGYDGNELIGYCWMQIYHNEIEVDLKEKPQARIYMLGVDPQHRRKGIGKILLLEGLRRLKNKAIQIVELNVDSKNKAACGLYRSQDFKVWKTSLWFEKVLD